MVQKLEPFFVGRKNTQKVTHIYRDQTDLKKDFITTRILWLKGLEKNVNSGKNISSYKRYIYIHGTNEEGLLGSPASDGCIRMNNQEVIQLFNLVNKNDLVIIQE